jgi:hypothetical protein
MTTGSIDLNRAPFSRYVKNWSGTNYPASGPQSIFQKVWKKVEADIDASIPGSRPGKGYTYLQRWEMRRAKARTTRVDHPYHMDLEFWTDKQGAYDILDVHAPHDYLGTAYRYFRELYSVGYTSSLGLLWGANDTISLQGKLREKIVGSDFDMSVFLGEGHQTLALILNSAVRIKAALDGFRKCDPGRVAKALGASPVRVRDIMRRNAKGTKLSPREAAEAASQAWIELQYGWKPLLSDAEGAAQALAQQLNAPAVQTYRVRKKNHTEQCSLASPNIKTFEYRAEVRGQLIARLTEVNVPALNGLMDPSSMAWELVPWSFVADWFIPIGSYLSARGLAQAVSGSFVTTISQREYFATESGLPLNLYTLRNTDFNFRRMRVIVDRTVSTSLLTPRPSFKPLAKVASWMHCANAVALLVTGFSGGKSSLGRAWTRPERKFRSNMSW